MHDGSTVRRAWAQWWLGRRNTALIRDASWQFRRDYSLARKSFQTITNNLQNVLYIYSIIHGKSDDLHPTFHFNTFIACNKATRHTSNDAERNAKHNQFDRRIDVIAQETRKNGVYLPSRRSPGSRRRSSA
jgi:hypothetical protein